MLTTLVGKLILTTSVSTLLDKRDSDHDKRDHMPDAALQRLRRLTSDLNIERDSRNGRSWMNEFNSCNWSSNPNDKQDRKVEPAGEQSRKKKNPNSKTIPSPSRPMYRTHWSIYNSNAIPLTHEEWTTPDVQDPLCATPNVVLHNSHYSAAGAQSIPSKPAPCPYKIVSCHLNPSTQFWEALKLPLPCVCSNLSFCLGCRS